MSNWKVIKTNIEVFDHPSADKLQLGKVGTYQVVVQKGLYEGGEAVVFAPEKSVLTGTLEQEYKDYLAGPDKNRVKAVRLRNELSCGIIIPPHLIVAQCGKTIDELPDDDLAEMLGISHYIPPVPTEMNGIAEPIEYDSMNSKHDCEQFGVYGSNFIDGERVIGSEKLHGSQIVAYASCKKGEIAHKWVSTKNYNKAGLCLSESDTNFYWRATRAINLWDIIADWAGVFHFQDSSLEETVVQVFGEALPCQALKYGLEEHTMRIFDVRINGVSIPYDQVPVPLMENWVPILYDGPYENVDDIKRLCKGMEQVSGTEANIKEGMVLRPYTDRRASDGTRLMVKIINPKYKETGDEFN